MVISLKSGQPVIVISKGGNLTKHLETTALKTYTDTPASNNSPLWLALNIWFEAVGGLCLPDLFLAGSLGSSGI